MPSAAPLLLAALALPQNPAAAGGDAPRDGLFPGDRLALVPVWTRIGDHSDRLRSVEAAEISPDGRRAVSGGKFGNAVTGWRLADGALLWEGAHEAEVECVCWSPDGSVAATGGEDFFVRFWDGENGDPLGEVELPAGPDGLAWSHDGRTIAAGLEDGTVALLDADEWTVTATLPGGSAVNSVQFTPDDRALAVAGNVQTTAGGRRAYAGFARRYDLPAGGAFAGGDPVGPTWEHAEPGGSLKSVRVRSAGDLCAVAGFDRRVTVLDWASGAVVKRLECGAKQEAVAFTPSGGFLVAGGHGPALLAWRTDTWEPVPAPAAPRCEYVHFSPDGRLMLTGHEDTGVLKLFLRDADLQGDAAAYAAESAKQLNNRDSRPADDEGGER